MIIGPCLDSNLRPRKVLYSGATRPLIRPPGRQRIAYLLQFVLLSLITNYNFQTFLITTNQKYNLFL